MTGTVKWYNEEKGYGFITPDEGGRDCFVHHTQILMEGFRSLNPDQKVEFSLEEGPKGFSAKQVKPL